MPPASRLDAPARKHLLFDFDGTIADSLGLVVDLYNGLAPRYGFRPMERARVAPEDVLYVGDELRDLEACRKVGVRMLAVTWGADTAEKLAAQGPAALVQSPEALVPTVLQLFRNSASDE